MKSCWQWRPRFHFNPRIPYGMRRRQQLLANRHHYHFNPRIPYGMRQSSIRVCGNSELFQSTHPVWDATSQPMRKWRRFSNFNPRIPYGMRLPRKRPQGAESIISIHASRMGCDSTFSLACATSSISIHASRMGCDVQWALTYSTRWIFQSTHPVWDAT